MAAIKCKDGTLERDIRATTSGEMRVKSSSYRAIAEASESGQSLSWVSANSDIDAGDTRLFIKNTSSKTLVISSIIFSPSNVVCAWDVGIGSATTTPTGTAVQGVVLNGEYSSTVHGYIAYDDETAVADASLIASITTSTVESKELVTDGVMLPTGHYIQINQETESTSGRVTVFGYYE